MKNYLEEAHFFLSFTIIFGIFVLVIAIYMLRYLTTQNIFMLYRRQKNNFEDIIWEKWVFIGVFLIPLQKNWT